MINTASFQEVFVGQVPPIYVRSKCRSSINPRANLFLLVWLSKRHKKTNVQLLTFFKRNEVKYNMAFDISSNHILKFLLTGLLKPIPRCCDNGGKTVT